MAIGRAALPHAILSPMRPSSPAWLFLLATLGVGVQALAGDEASTATGLIEQGLDLRQAQHDAEALVLFEKAQALAPTPRGQAQVALAEQALGRWVPAEKNLRAALAATGDGWIVSRRPVLERDLGVIQGHLGDVEIVGAKAGLVYVDGVPIEEPDARTRLRLEVGQRTLEIRTQGSYPFSRILDVRPGETLRVEVEQRPLLGEIDPPPAPRPGLVVAAPPVSHTQRTIGWIALGAAGALVATGAAGLIERSVAAGSFNGNATCTGRPSNDLSSTCQDLLGQGSTGQTVAIVGFVGGGVVSALAVALLLTAPSMRAKTNAWTLPCTPTRFGAACSLGGTF